MVDTLLDVLGKESRATLTSNKMETKKREGRKKGSKEGRERRKNEGGK